jgi:hypothetical protein
MPSEVILITQSLLIALPPLGVVLVTTVVWHHSPVRLSLTLAMIIAGMLPALVFRPMGALTPEWLVRAPLLMPGFSAGVAVGFCWPPPVDPAPRSTAWGVGMRAAGLAAAGYCMPILGLLAYQAYAALTFARPCPGANCYTQVLSSVFQALVEIFAAFFAILLVLAGGALGALLRDR